MKRLIASILFLIVLITANAMRFETIASKAENHYVRKWVQDKWAGDIWVTTYLPTGIQMQYIYNMKAIPTRPGEYKEGELQAVQAAINKRVTYTYIWYGAIIFAIIWIMWEANNYNRYRGKEENRATNKKNEPFFGPVIGMALCVGLSKTLLGNWGIINYVIFGAIGAVLGYYSEYILRYSDKQIKENTQERP